ncbi:MAG TPA: penicillin acylase family protein [Nocardioides sp.]|nr:penicillin acylase family protein [Nocardioides sp.]
MARLYRDEFGVPHLRASSVLDLARAQGEVTAIDRTWQLEWLRRRAEGTTAAALGEGGVAWDRFSRRLETRATAERALEACSPETRAFVEAYVDGVNSGLGKVHRDAVPELAALDLTPGEWEPWHPLGTFLAQHLLFGGIGGSLWGRLARAVLGDDARLLSHEGPLQSGSNAWAVGGARTASGHPLIGGDPHRIIELPGVYQQVRLACEDPEDAFDVLGFTFVGVPGVQHFAHAGEVAWAITNAMADYQDVVDEPLPLADVVRRRTETVEVRDAGPVEVEIAETTRGMVFDEGLSVRTSSWVLGNLGFDAILPLLRARTVDDVDRALDLWVEPVNNAVIADRSGAVRYRIAGRVPVRDDAGWWIGWLAEPNRAEAPADGHVVTANERRGAESAAVGSVFAPPYRAARLRDLLDGRTGLEPEDFVAFHNDSLLLSVERLRTLVPGAFDDFDGRMEADSTQAARYAAWRAALVRRLAAEPVFRGLFEPPEGFRYDPLFAGWLDPTTRIGLALPTLVDAGTPFGIDLAALAQAALRDVEATEAAGGLPAVWGDTHVVTPVHALEVYDGWADHVDAWQVPPLPVSGDADCVRCCASYPGITDECFRGSVARYVWDLADRTAGGWVVPTGACGVPGDPHFHDQLPLWAEGTLAPIVTDWERLTEVR